MDLEGKIDKIDEIVDNQTIEQNICKEIIYEGLDLLEKEDKSHKRYWVDFKFGMDLEISLGYSSKASWRNELTLLPNSIFSLSYIRIGCLIDNPAETIEKIYSETSSNHKSPDFSHSELFLKDVLIPKNDKKSFKKNKHWNRLIIDRLVCEYKDERDHYVLNSGIFGYIYRGKMSYSIEKKLKEKILKKLHLQEILSHESIQQIVPFTKKAR